MLDGLPRPASIVAIQECHLMFVTRDYFRKYARQHPEIFEHLTVMLSRRLRETDDLLAATSFLTVKARLARSMLELVKHLGQRKANNTIEIPHRITQNDLAAMAGVARENVDIGSHSCEGRCRIRNGNCQTVKSTPGTALSNLQGPHVAPC